MNALGILLHISALIHLGQDIKGIIENMTAKKESWPSKDECLKLIDDALVILSSGVFSFPDDVKTQIVAVLNGLKSELSA